MRSNLIWSSVMALCVFLTSFSHADVIVDLNFEDSGPSLGDALEAATSAGFDNVTFPLSFGVDAVGDVAAPGSELVVVTVSGSSNDPGADFNGLTSAFGIASSSGDSFRFDASQNEQLVLSFDRNVEILEIDFESLFGSDVFQVGDQIVTSGDVDGFDRFDPTNDGANSGIILAANTPLVFQSTSGAIGLEQINIDVSVVPEPSSMLALMGLAGRNRGHSFQTTRRLWSPRPRKFPRSRVGL